LEWCSTLAACYDLRMHSLPSTADAQPRIGSLFTGYGGLDMAARAIFGGRTAWVSDIKPAAVALLAQRYPDVPNLGDITLVDPRDVDPVTILTFGWPCQPFSSAGKRLGEADHRALWPHVARVVAELRPAVLLGENVARVAGNGELRRVVRTLAALGYVGTWRCVPASDVGAPHKRDRCFVVALRADVAADPLGLELRDESGWRGGPDGAGTRVAGHDGPAGSDRLTLLPTPTKSMTTGAGTSGREGGMNLQTAAALLPSPRWGRYATAVERWERVLGRPAPDPTMVSPRTGGPQLAPAFVEWMMGVPAGWVSEAVDLARRPTGLRNARLSLLGDGVVPQQAEHAYRLALAELLGGERAAA